MKLKKFKNFISEELLPVITKTRQITKKVTRKDIEEGNANGVIDRLSMIYKDLTSDEKKDVDKYFEKQ